MFYTFLMLLATRQQFYEKPIEEYKITNLKTGIRIK